MSERQVLPSLDTVLYKRYSLHCSIDKHIVYEYVYQGA